MYCKRDDDCAADMQIIVRKDAWATSLMIIVRGCTKDLLELEPAVKTILYYARKASSSPNNFKAGLSFFYSALTWKERMCTNFDLLFLKMSYKNPIVISN